MEEEQFNPAQKPKKRATLFIAIAAVLLAAIIVILIIGTKIFKPGDAAKPASTSTASKSDDAAAAKLFDAISKSAARQTIKVAQLRKTFALKADLESNTDPGFVQSSVSEVDAAAGKYRALYAQKTFESDIYHMQRCMDGTTYIDGIGSSIPRQAPKSLTEANDYLKQMYKISQDLQFIICPHIGVMPGAAVDMAPAHLSDGIMPVTLNDAQAADWKAKILAANLFNVADQGMVDHGGKQLHKYSFTPRDDAAHTNQKLYDIFYAAAQIDKLKREHPDAEWQYEFIAVNHYNSGSVEGFYLIDDQTGLPAYSEIKGISPDVKKDSQVSRNNIGFNKQTYAYPSALTLSLSSPLEFLE